MNQNKTSTCKCLNELPFIFCGESGDIEVHEDVDPELFYHLKMISKLCNVDLRIIKDEPLCPVCGKPLNRNGTKLIYLDKTFFIKKQKYNHDDCPDSSCISSTEHIKEHACNYSKKIQDKTVSINLVNPESYQKKSEEIENETGVKIPKSTLYYYHENRSDEYFDYLETLQFKKIEELKIKPSGTFCYDEQYVFVNKILYMRLTLIDYKNKLIINEELISSVDFTDKTIERFLKTSLENLPLKAIITDGRTSYNNIIDALGAIHHKCYFHIMQNLMTPLNRYISGIERKIKNNEKRIKIKEKTIKLIKTKKTNKQGYIPLKDKKTREQNKEIRKLEKEIKELKQENREKTREINKINYDKERIQNIWKSKDIKQAKRRFNTIYNQREQLNKIISNFLKRIEKDIENILNHFIHTEIPATNNTVENYYRTTLPRAQKRIYRTLKGLQRRIREQQIRWTHRNVLKQTTPINRNTTYN